MTKKLQPFFWLALLAHLLLMLSFSLNFLWTPDVQPFDKKSDEYLPAYLQQQQQVNSDSKPYSPPEKSKAAPIEQQETQDKAIAIKKEERAQKKEQDQESTQQPTQAQNKKQSSAAFIEATSPTEGKPIDEPLMKELSRATAAKLFYPRDAAIYHITGTVTIGFLLHPDGQVTEVTLLKSSGFPILDNAALNTIRSISPVRDANLYLNSAKTMVAGIIFG